MALNRRGACSVRRLRAHEGRRFLGYQIRGTLALSTTVDHLTISVSTKALICRRVLRRTSSRGNSIKSRRSKSRGEPIGFLILGFLVAFAFPSFAHASAARCRTPESALEWMHRQRAEYDGRDDGQRAIGRDQLNGRSYPNATLQGPSVFRRKIAHGRSPTYCRPRQNIAVPWLQDAVRNSNANPSERFRGSQLFSATASREKAVRTFPARRKPSLVNRRPAGTGLFSSVPPRNRPPRRSTGRRTGRRCRPVRVRRP